MMCIFTCACFFVPTGLRFRSVSRCLRKSNRYIKKLKKKEDDELMMKTSTKKQQMAIHASKLLKQKLDDGVN